VEIKPKKTQNTIENHLKVEKGLLQNGKGTGGEERGEGRGEKVEARVDTINAQYLQVWKCHCEIQQFVHLMC
jgi:hypothetical protein